MGKITLQDARHLSMRTGLGARWQELNRYRNLSRRNSVKHAVYSASNRWALPPPKLASWTPWNPKHNVQQRRHLQVCLMRDKHALREWTVKNMLRTPYPLTERLVLFWHNHFTSSINEVNQPNLLLKQNILFRRHGMGNYKQLLHEVSRDPAMLIYLDNTESKMGNPNENFARELLELYTLGEGHYRESDVQNAARAFTGWTVDRRRQRFVLRKDLHDNGIKHFMGKKGRFNGHHIIDILLAKPQTAEMIATKFWYEFISDGKPNPHIIRRWGNVFRHAKYDIRTLLMAVLNSPEFWSKRNRGEKIKSPIELVVGTLRTLTLKPLSTRRIVDICDALGQKIMAPETPEGHLGGQQWIDTVTLPTRVNLMAELIYKSDQRDMARIPKLSVSEKTHWLLARRSINKIPSQSSSHEAQLLALLTDPAYQLT